MSLSCLVKTRFGREIVKFAFFRLGANVDRQSL